uniref:SFRICE_037020 n=1 Tax=Spodoptera frugiperda TaxID=7108 RepID=A0A2H1WGQ7_SPOFR
MYIFKDLRHIADYKLIKQVYLALCQSVLTYCITSWGGTAKFPTHQLNTACKILTVRPLFILQTILYQHSELPFDPVSQTGRRRDLVCFEPQTRHAFAHRFYVFLGPFLYNKVNKILNIYSVNYYKCSTLLSEYLVNLDYTDTEKLLEVLFLNIVFVEATAMPYRTVHILFNQRIIPHCLGLQQQGDSKLNTCAMCPAPAPQLFLKMSSSVVLADNCAPASVFLRGTRLLLNT